MCLLSPSAGTVLASNFRKRSGHAKWRASERFSQRTAASNWVTFVECEHHSSPSAAIKCSRCCTIRISRTTRRCPSTRTDRPAGHIHSTTRYSTIAWFHRVRREAIQVMVLGQCEWRLCVKLKRVNKKTFSLGVWQVPMVMWQDLNGGRCSMGDACSNPPDSEGVTKMLMKNFDRHYTTNRWESHFDVSHTFPFDTQNRLSCMCIFASQGSVRSILPCCLVHSATP